MEKYNLSYDESDIIDNQVKYLMSEEGEFKGRDEDEVREKVYEDYDLLNFAWDDFKECMTEYLKDIDKNGNGVFKVNGKSMGWRNLDGFKIVAADDGQELLTGILPETDVSLYIWKTKTQIKIRCSHHDSPMGEWYYIKALNKKEFKEYEEDLY